MHFKEEICFLVEKKNIKFEYFSQKFNKEEVRQRIC